MEGPRSPGESAHNVFNMEREEGFVPRIKRLLRWFLSSKWGHYFVIILVSLDIACIFADFLVSLHVCEHKREDGFDEKAWLTAEDILGAFSLVFSALFVVELLASLFAFGFGSVPLCCSWPC